MLSISLNDAARRGTWTCLSCSTLPWGFRAWITSSSRPLATPTHQRKHSSSKPSSSPKDESSVIATPSEAPAKETKSAAKESTEQRTSSRVSRRKPKDIIPGADKGKNGALLNIPSVPSTQSLKPQDIHVASFFSIHRPISVTTSVPPASNPAAFSTIFTPRNYQKPQSADVIYTISSAVENIENATSHSYPQQSQPAILEDADLHTAIASSSHADPSRQQSLHINVEELAKHFRPFEPPPPPIAEGPARNVSQRNAATTQKSYSTVLTIVESIHPNGLKSYQHSVTPFREHSLKYPELDYTDAATGVSSPLIPRQPFLNHMRERQLRWENFREGNVMGPKVWRAISVKRQRKLKMKKHKYKKLMRRTRNLRRKLDRT